MKKKVYIVVNNHFDLLWRRCFKRAFRYKDEEFVSYEKIQEYYIKDNLLLCEKYEFYRFEIESPAVLRNYLKNNPKDEKLIRELLDSGRIYIPFCGDNIVDSNMISGESIIRNYLYGYRYLNDNFQYVPEGVDRNDAFGNSAQLPQIIRGFGEKWVSNITYSLCDKDYWRGLDGSVVYNFKPEKIGNTGGYYKYPPCPKCKGIKKENCDLCNGRGIDLAFAEGYRTKIDIDEENTKNIDVPGYIIAGGEEILPNEYVINWYFENCDKYDIEFAGFNEIVKKFNQKIDAMDNLKEEDIYHSAEINCNNTGCYVSRIKIKQRLRELENKVFGAESVLASVCFGKKNYPYGRFSEIWEKMLFTMFHDCITSTHIDAAYQELTETFDIIESEVDKLICEYISEYTNDAQNCFSVLNPTGAIFSGQICANLPENAVLVDDNGEETDGIEKNGKKVFYLSGIEAFSAKTYKIATRDSHAEIISYDAEKCESADAVLTNASGFEVKEINTTEILIETDSFKIRACGNGIISIYDKKLNKEIAKKGEYYVGEWILEHDEGSPWATLSPDMRRIKLSDRTKLISVEKTDTYQKLTYRITPNDLDAYVVKGFKVEYSLIVYNNSETIYFESDVDWNTQNHRLRIAFPVETEGRHIYQIPYGIIDRAPYEHTILNADGTSNWASAAGDYPTIGFGGIEGKEFSVALFNKGTPSYQINKDSLDKNNIFISVLRSPSVGTYLHEPFEYTMLDYDGMRDTGEHHFEHALKAYGSGFSDNLAVCDAVNYNCSIITSMGRLNDLELPRIKNGSGVIISSIKGAEDNDGIICRIVEYHGQKTKFILDIPTKMKTCFETDMKETPVKEFEGKEIEIEISPYEIKTFKII